MVVAVKGVKNSGGYSHILFYHKAEQELALRAAVVAFLNAKI